MIYYVGQPIKNSDLFFKSVTFDAFVEWITPLQIYQHDLESNVTTSIVERKMTLAQYGDIRGKDQYVLDIRKLSQKNALRLIDIMNNPLQVKVIHNVSFEYSLWKKYGVILSNLYDTMLCEKIIWCGYSVEPGFYSLAGLYKRYLFKELDKTLQTSFDTDAFSVEQIFYAAQDVKELGGIRRLQIDSLRAANLLNVAALENEAVCGFSEIEINGMKLNVEAWRDNIKFADPIIDKAAAELNVFLRTEEFKQSAIDLGYLNDKDTLTINWNSTLQKKLVFDYLFPNLIGITQPSIKKYIKNEELSSAYHRQLLESYLLKDYSLLEHELLTNHKEFLISNQLLVPADTATISWTSGKQALSIFKVIYPKLKSVSKEALSDCDHPIIEAYHEFLNTTKLKTTYGEKFIQEHVDSDGRVRTNFNQVLNTGRVSSSKPNIQNIPAKETLEIKDKEGNIIAPYTRYRNAFIADKGWHFVDSDYKSQEAVLVASFSGDKIWMEAIKKEQDLHSICAEVVFKDKWLQAADSNCAYYKIVNGEPLHDKCKCKKHKTLRTLVKTLNFGLIYGMSKYKLSATAKVSLEEAQETIIDYFKSFPGIAGILDGFGAYGVRNGFIMTSKPFLRRRYYDYWEGNQHDRKTMGKIDRASRNMPFQGTAGDITKLALCLMDWTIKDNKLQDRVKIVCQVHDQLTTNVREDYVEEWLPIMDKCMTDAADFILPAGLLKAETLDTGFCWTK